MRMRGIASGLASAVLVMSLAMQGCGFRPTPADVVLRNGYVYTVDGRTSVRSAVAVRSGIIVFVGTESDARPYVGANTQVIDLGGRMLMPGFVDAHLHSLGGGRALLLCNLNYAPLSHAQLRAAIQSCLDSTTAKEPDGWLEVVNWDRASTLAIDGDPTRATLDVLTTRRPIAVRSTDYHTLLVNSRALALAGVTAATPDPVGGHFARDAAGSPTGICEDQAGWQVAASIPPDTEAELMAQGRAALAAFRAQGITTFRDAAAGDVHGRIFTALQQSGELTARALLDVNLSPSDAVADPAGTIAAARALATRYDQGRARAAPGIQMHTVKVFMDGIVNAPADTGALLSPYFTNLGTAAAPDWQQVAGSNSGDVYYPAGVLQPLMLAAADAQLDMQVHATGERAVREALDAVAYVRTQSPSADFRPAIAHDETVAVADYARFQELDVSAIMSFQWAQQAPYSVGDTADHLGPDRFARMEPFGSLNDAGARVAFGSDWPIDPFDDMLALKIGVTRSGDPTSPNCFGPAFAGRINDDPALSRVDAVRAITMNAAHALRLEQQVGSIEVGKFADLIVLDKNFMQVPDEELARNQVLLTMTGGRIVMGLPPFASLVAASTTAVGAPLPALNFRAAVGHAAIHPGHAGGDGHHH